MAIAICTSIVFALIIIDAWPAKVVRGVAMRRASIGNAVSVVIALYACSYITSFICVKRAVTIDLARGTNMRTVTEGVGIEGTIYI